MGVVLKDLTDVGLLGLRKGSEVVGGVRRTVAGMKMVSVAFSGKKRST